jgi:hypothetical protein
MSGNQLTEPVIMPSRHFCKIPDKKIATAAGNLKIVYKAGIMARKKFLKSRQESSMPRVTMDFEKIRIMDIERIRTMDLTRVYNKKLRDSIFLSLLLVI